MAASSLPPIDFLRECFSYDAATGSLRWRVRPTGHFERDHIARAWNSRHAGSEAFTSTRGDGYLAAEVLFEGRSWRISAHRVAFAMTKGWVPEVVDHVNRDRLDNREENLRAATFAQNSHNAPGSRVHPLPKGVFFERGIFHARIGYRGRKYRLGTFKTPAAAHAAYCDRARALHGEFFHAGPEKPSVFD